MKKAIVLSCVPGNTPEERFANAKQGGFCAVEVPTLDTIEEREEHLALAKKYGVTIHSVMCTGHWGYPLSSPEDAVVEKCLESIRHSVDTAVYCGADTVLVVPGVVTDTVPYEFALARSMESMKKIAPYAEERKIILALENVWNKFLLSPVEFVKFIDDVGSDFVKAYFDVGNIVFYGYPQHWIASIGNRLSKVHIKGFDAGTRDFTPLLVGSINWNAVMEALRGIGYDGYITAELGADDRGVIGISNDMDKIFAL